MNHSAMGYLAILVAIFVAMGAIVAPAQTNQIFDLGKVWRFDTNNLDAVTWQQPGYDDSAWASGGGLLFITDATLPGPKTTLLPSAGQYPYPTYYFRTSFVLSNTADLSLLTFSNLVDDGAVLYLNGIEVQRMNMPPWPPVYGTYASRAVNATGFRVFSLGGTELASAIDGTNVLAVQVHQRNASSGDVVFGASLTSVHGLVPAALTRGPYLQLGTPQSVIVRWRTQVPCASRVVLGTNLNQLDQEVMTVTPTMQHSVLLTNLQPSSRYYYAVGTATNLLCVPDEERYYQTAPLPGTAKPIRIWAIGDAGTAESGQMTVRDAYYALAGTNHTDVWLQLGDNAYHYGDDAEHQAAVFNIYDSLLARTVTWPALGNHDTALSKVFSDDYPYFEIFTLPTAGEAGGVASGTEHYYSFNYGNVHFICLDSTTADRSTNGAMANWLRMDLLTNTNPWVIAYCHHPPYSRGSHNTDATHEIESLEMRQNFLPILEAGGVDLMLSGHSHSYERSHLLDGHYGNSPTLMPRMVLNGSGGRETNGEGAYAKPYQAAHQGTVYAVVGSSGMVSGGTLDHPAMFLSLNRLGSMVIDVNGSRLDAVFLRETGETNDWFTIVKGDYRFLLGTPERMPNGLYRIRGQGIPGRQYIIQTSTNLVAPGWDDLGTAGADGDGAFEYPDPAPEASGHRFYRARQ